jgi:N-acetyl-gamma-glutamylphosphate reductase
MAPKLFMYGSPTAFHGPEESLLILSSTGTTGYIGGDALYTIANAHPDWEITCLVRNSSKGAKVASQYPKVNLVYGDLDSTELIETECKKADLIYRTALRMLDCLRSWC